MPGCPPGATTVDVRDLRSLLYHFDRIDAELRAIHQAAASDSQTADSEPQAGLRRNGETQECPCNACHKERLAAIPPADRTGSLMALASRGTVLCPTCGNKRCPHANDHRNACTGSNEPGQAGSAYPDVTIIRLGVYGRAFDGPQTRRAYTYQHQPDNLDAGKLGRAAASTSPGGDSIDHGLSLLKELQARGFGVFELGDQQEGGA
ncbi:MAG: hypothetical protein ACRC02_15745 [Vogesella sp.]|uniref:hypothetical protein n=1 Tax=Vogesella sp. TaxID=1904252 RepID=UPI003F2DFB76